MFGEGAKAQAPEQLKVKNYVSDFANVLSPAARDQINALAAEVDRKADAQIAVVTVKTLDGKPIEDYSIDLATRLGVGPKASNRGVLILLAVNDHQYRIEVGYGLEGILPDGKVGRHRARSGAVSAAEQLRRGAAADDAARGGRDRRGSRRDAHRRFATRACCSEAAERI